MSRREDASALFKLPWFGFKGPLRDPVSPHNFMSINTL